jgi:hypothetical protein
MSNCPAVSSSTIVSNGVTIGVTVGGVTGGSTYVTTHVITGTAAATNTFNTGACPAPGWSSCAASVGGGCCPPNYGCGTSCSATGGGASGVVSKIAPNSGTGLRAELLGLLWISICAGLGIGMVLF